MKILLPFLLTGFFLFCGVNSLFAQTCDLTVYVLAENTRGLVKTASVTALNLNTLRTYQSILVGENPEFRALPAGKYVLQLQKSGFATDRGQINVRCGSGSGRTIYTMFTMCSGDIGQVFEEDSSIVFDGNTSTVPPRPDFVCKQLRQKPELNRQAKLNETAKWVEVERNTKNEPYFVDTASVQRTGDSVVFRVKSETGGAYDYFTARASCSSKTMTISSRFFSYDQSPRLVAEDEDEKLLQTKEGTILYGLIDYACSNVSFKP